MKLKYFLCFNALIEEEKKKLKRLSCRRPLIFLVHPANSLWCLVLQRYCVVNVPGSRASSTVAHYTVNPHCWLTDVGLDSLYCKIGQPGGLGSTSTNLEVPG